MITALVGVAVLLLAMLGTSGVLLVQVRRAQNHVVSDYYEVGRLAQNNFLQLVDAETLIRTYRANPDVEAIAPYLKGTSVPWQAGTAKQVGAMLGDNPQAQASITRLSTAVATWQGQWALPMLEMIRRGETPSVVQIRSEGQLFDAVRADYNAFIANVRAGRAAALDRLSTLTNMLFGIELVSPVLALAVTGLLGGLLRRWVGRPLASLANETRVVSSGQLDHRVSVHGPPEMVDLGADIDTMRRRLVDQIAALELAGREVASAQLRLQEQAEELQRSNSELEQFAYVASHDLQEPLRKVASFCQLLQRRYGGQLDDRADQYIAFAVDGAKRMQQLINALLDFSRVGRHVEPLAVVDLAACLVEALRNLEAAREESGVQIDAAQLPMVRGEGPLLVQLLQNLIGNAIKFRSDSPPQVRIGGHPSDDGFWEFWCADNGIGVEPEYAERVFMIFQRLHPKEVYEGTGIGLAMCKKIVEYHGGRIWIDTGVTTGTTVRWSLPAASAPAGPDPQPPRAHEPSWVRITS